MVDTRVDVRLACAKVASIISITITFFTARRMLVGVGTIVIVLVVIVVVIVVGMVIVVGC